MKKSETASEIFLKSNNTMCSPFLSCMADVMTFRILLFFVNLDIFFGDTVSADLDAKRSFFKFSLSNLPKLRIISLLMMPTK
jgi:hypothetical protein